MHCPQCGINIPNPGTHCPACQASLMKSCPACHYKNLSHQQFCGQCGSDLNATAHQGLQTKTPAEPKTEALSYMPVLSAEILNLDKLGERLNNPGQLARLTKDLMGRLESQLTAQGATIESIRDSVIFFSFRHGTVLGEVLSRALKVGIALVKKTIRLQDIDLQIRVGLDVVHINERSPMTGVAERLVARPGQIVVSYNVFQMTNKQLPYETIGPIKVQGEMKTFFKIAMERQAPPPSPPQAAMPQDPTPPNPVAQESAPETGVPENTPEYVSHEAQPSTPPPQEMAAPPPGLITEAPATPQRIAPMERKIEPVEQPGSLNYEPPDWVMRQKESKISNISYQHAIHSLENELKDALQNPKSKVRLVALAGPSGSGKSTILNMIRSNMQQDAQFWVGGHFYEGYFKNLFPLQYWFMVIQDLVGFALEGVPQDQGREHLQNMLQSVFAENYTPDKLDFFETFLSLKPLHGIQPDSRQYLGRLIPFIADLLNAMASIKPLMLVMEDLQFADSASMELFSQLLQHNLLSPNITIIMTYTPDLVLAGNLQQLFNLSPFKELILDPLDEENLVSMAEVPLTIPWKKLPDAFRAQLLEKGSPLFLEEAFRWLLLNGGFSIHPKSGKFNPEKKLKTLTAPEDVRQLIYDRILHMDDAGRYVLQVASVLGERFSTKALMDMTQMQDKLETVLQMLWQNGFIVPDTGNSAKFRHPLIWQLAYQSLEEDVRRQQHQLVLDYMLHMQGQGLGINPVLIAYHAMNSGNMSQAMAMWQNAAVWLTDVGSITGANIGFYFVQRFMEADATNIDPMQQKQVYESLGILNMDASPEYAKNLFLTALRFQGQSISAEQIQMQILLAQTYERLGSYPMATSTIYRARESINPNEHPVESVALALQEVWYLHILGNYQEALWVYQEYVAPRLPEVENAFLSDLSLRSTLFRGELARTRAGLFQCQPWTMDVIDKLLAQCDISDDRFMGIHFRIARSLGMLLRGNYEGCQRELDPLIADVETLPQQQQPELMVWWGLVVLLYHIDQGDWQNASMLVPNTSFQAEQARDFLAWSLCQTLAGRISSASGNHSEAQQILEQAVTVSAQYFLSHPALLGWRMLTENDLALNNLDTAEEICQRALDIAQKPHIHNTYEFYQLTITHARLLLARKSFKEAGALLEKHWPALVKSGYMPLVAEVAFLISQLYGQLAATLPEPHQSKYRGQQQNFLQKAKTLWQEQGNSYRLAPLLQQEAASASF